MVIESALNSTSQISIQKVNLFFILIFLNYFFDFHKYRVFFFNSVIYDLALIQSFFGIFEIGRTFFDIIHRRIFKNAKTLLIGQILV